jgi:glycosyltransferase involved in cell wall biosynthesis
MRLKIGVAIQDTWAFFNEIYAELREYHDTKLFESRSHSMSVLNGRIKKFLIQQDLKNFLRTNDVAFFEWSSGLLAQASYLPKKAGIVTRLHRYELYQWAEKINWNVVDKIILVSKAKKREFQSLLPEQESKIVIIPEAISLGKFPLRSRRFRGDIGTLCSLVPRKRLYELILAFYELCAFRNDFHLHLGGGSRPLHKDYHEALFQLVYRLGISSKVTFYDHVENSQGWYQNIDIFVSNSYSEGLQVAPMEAMASGCYCLSHRWEGAEELLPEENLFYTNKELIELIIRYADCSEEEKSQQKERLRNIIHENFNVEKTKVQIRRVIEEVGASMDS